MSNTICVPTNWRGLPHALDDTENIAARSEATYVKVSVHLTYNTYRTGTMEKIRFSYAKFPILSFIMNALAVLSMTGLLLYVFWGIQTVHPYVLFWLLVASTGLSFVILTAAGEFNESKKK